MVLEGSFNPKTSRINFSFINGLRTSKKSKNKILFILITPITCYLYLNVKGVTKDQMYKNSV